MTSSLPALKIFFLLVAGLATGCGTNVGNVKSEIKTGVWLDSIDKKMATSGDEIILYGVGFDDEVRILVDAVPTSPTSVSSKEIKFVMPEGKPGLVTLMLTKGDFVSSSSIVRLSPDKRIPLSMGNADQFCTGQKFYDMQGEIQTGSAPCKSGKEDLSATTPDPVAEPSEKPLLCEVDGQIGCLTSADFPSVRKKMLLPENIVKDITLGGVKGIAAPAPADCDADGKVGCVSTSVFKAVDTGSFTAHDVRISVVVGGVTGSMPGSLPGCTGDGEIGCATNGTYKAVLVTGLAGKITTPNTVAGVVGNVTLPPVAEVLTGSVYGSSGSQTGLLTLPGVNNVRTSNGNFGIGGNTSVPALVDCAEGSFGCYVVGPLQAAATLTGLNSKVLSGQTVAGVPGNVTLPAVGKVLTGTPYGISGTGMTGTLVSPAAGNVLSTATPYGDPGTPTVPLLNLPVAGNVLSGTGAFGNPSSLVTPTLTLPLPGKVLTASGNYGNPAALITPTLTLPDAGKVHVSNGSYGDPGSAATPTLILPLTDKVLAGTVYGLSGTGSTGTLTLPAAGNVLLGTSNYGDPGAQLVGSLTLPLAANVRTVNGSFGAGGTGSAPALGDCAADGIMGCVTVAGFKSADMAVAIPGNIKSTIVIAGITGTNISSPPNCAVEGATGCVAVTNFPAVDKMGNVTANVGKIRDSVTIAGVTGTLADCTDGAAGCVAVGPTQAAAVLTNLADKVLSGQSVAGVGGNIVLPPVGKVLTATSYGVSGTGLTGTLSLPVAGKVLTGSGTYGDPSALVTPTLTLPPVGKVLAASGNYGDPGSPNVPTLVLPAAANVLTGTGAFGDPGSAITPTLTLPAVGKVLTATVYGSGGTGSTGTLVLPVAGKVLTGSGNFGDPGFAVTPTLVLPVAANVLTGTAAFGDPGSVVTPTLTLPAGGKVLAAISYGPGGSGNTGTLVLPAAGKVLTGSGNFGDPGSAVTPTLVLPTAANVLTGTAAFGDPGSAVTPTLTLPAVGKVLAAITYGPGGTGNTGTLVLPAAANVLTGTTAFGDPGSAVTPTLTLPAVGKVLAAISYGPGGSGNTGTLVLPSVANVLTGSGTFGDPGATLTPTLTLPLAGKVLSGSGSFGDPGAAVTPTLTLPSGGNVIASNGNYGDPGTPLVPSLTLPAGVNVKTTNGVYGVSGTGSSPLLPVCTSAGSQDCVVEVSWYAGQICATDGSGCYLPPYVVSTQPKKAINYDLILSVNIKNGATIAGVSGTYPSAGNLLPDASAVVDLTDMNSTMSAGTYEWWDSAGTRRTGDVIVANGGSNIVPGVSVQTFNNGGGLYREFAVDGDTDMVNTNVKNGVNLFGVVGTYLGSVAPSCSTDGELGCKTDASYPAAKISQIAASDLRFGKSIAGIPGARKHCRNQAKQSIFDFDGGGADYRDSLDGRFTWSEYTFGNSNTACMGEAFLDVTQDGACDTGGDECVFRDTYTGQEVASMLNGAKMTWPSAITWCDGLTWNARTDWRLATQFEALQLHIDGVGFVSDSYTFFTTNDLGHTSTTQASLLTSNYQINLRDGTVAKFDKTSGGTASRKPICVRDTP